ncbi:alcohol dehydrogenase catalytic domain-containing protein [Nocardia veterana]|uniref:Alcohol dehydrogenase catalytic domain-containing protein n=1 Tax=Nocardia veterana TaxID=132249 RepID=A0A7X6LYR5_9NOCA|nr:alcohol dehydrogenase catalytic domain-containing protein [Nocardia veterana]NKY87032.1 alcohol dehydrogenase catalytic domain-containing protein [Nocardia veterana]
MQALIFDERGNPLEVLRPAQTTAPPCGPGEVRIRVAASVIQPADELFVTGAYTTVQPTYPQVAGFEGVGVVTDVGPGVGDVRPGRRVAFRSPGAWAQVAVAPRARVYPVPIDLSDRIPDEVACQLPLNPLTAWGLLDGVVHRPGMRVLLTAGRSVVASILAELATRQGLSVERLIREADGYRLIDHTGATIALGPTVEHALTRVEPYHLVFDPVGGPDTTVLIARTVPGGYLVSYGVLDDRPFEVTASTILYKSLHWQGFAISTWLDRVSATTLDAATATCWSVLAERGDLLPIAGRYPLAEFRAALSHARESAGQGKVVLAMP